MTRGEAVTFLREYIKTIPRYNFEKCGSSPEYKMAVMQDWIANKLIQKIQDIPQDPIRVVYKFCNLMSYTLTNAEESHQITIRFASMAEFIGRDILRQMREKELRKCDRRNDGRPI